MQDTDPEMLAKVQPKVSPEMNDLLMAPYAVDDVKMEVNNIGDIKAPGMGYMQFFIKNIGTFSVRKLHRKFICY